MNIKKCNVCGILKLISDFYKYKRNRDGYENSCKLCKKEYQNTNKSRIKEIKKQYYIENIDYFKQYKKDYKEKYPDRISESNRKYVDNNREKIKDNRNKNHKNRMLEDDFYKFKFTIKNIITKSLKRKGFLKNSRTNEILGCSYLEFRFYLEEKFEPWMTWENHGLYNGDFKYGWDIDHIVPLSSGKTEDDIIRLCHYTNLQPLCSKINRDLKSDKIITD